MLSRSPAYGWVFLVAITAAAIGLSRAFDINQRWADAVIYTVVVFTVVVQMLRPGWQYPAVWKSLSLILCMHSLSLVFFVQVMPQRWKGIPGIVMMAAGISEALLIISVLWRRAGLPKEDDG